MPDTERLLTVQDIDTRLDQLRHRRQGLDQRQGLVDARQALADSEADLVTAFARHEDLLREQKRFEDEAAGVEEKANRAQATLYGGTVTAAKELEALQADVESLRRRQRQLEDEVLDLMEQLEPVDAAVTDARAGVGRAAAAVEASEAALFAAEAEIDQEVASITEARAAAAEPVDPALLAEYERLRSGFGGVAVARLVGDSCHGCVLNLTFSAGELDRIRHAPPDAVVHCDECGRILAR